jgi:hypothetical protein
VKHILFKGILGEDLIKHIPRLEKTQVCHLVKEGWMVRPTSFKAVV